MLLEFDGKRPQIHKDAFIAPNATLIGDVRVEAGASIWFGTQIRADEGTIFIGARSNVQDNAVIHTLPNGVTCIEEDVTVGHGAMLHNCTIKRGSVIGINAVILDNAIIGEKAMVAALSLVSAGSEIPARFLAVGSPAKPKKELAGDSLWWVQQSSAAYSSNAQSYLQQGIGKVE